MDKPQKSIGVCLNPKTSIVLKEVLIRHLEEHDINVITGEGVVFPYQKPCPVRDIKLKE